MPPLFLYVAYCTSDTRFGANHIYKVGHSQTPVERIRSLGGSGSTETYAPLLILPLPTYVKDLHVLVHRSIAKYVVHSHPALQDKYLALFGVGHADGLRRRRELVMFGKTFSRSRIKALFRRAVQSVQSDTGGYRCSDATCVSNQGAAHCTVCVTFIRSLLNSIKCQSLSSALGRKAAEAQLVQLLSTTRRSQWAGPARGSFWAVHTTARRLVLVQVHTVDRRRRRSEVSLWTPVEEDRSDVLKSRFTCDATQRTTTMSWDTGHWRCCVSLLHGRIRNPAEVAHATQH